MPWEINDFITLLVKIFVETKPTVREIGFFDEMLWNFIWRDGEFFKG